MDRIATAAIFNVFNNETKCFDEVEVPLADIQTSPIASPYRYKVSKVRWSDGSWSWGKAWWFSDTNKIARIGAGAYGDAVVWESPFTQFPCSLSAAA